MAYTREDELIDGDDRYKLSNDKASYECNYAGYDVDNALGYCDADSCADGDYCDSAGKYNKYNADDKHEAAANGVDEYDDIKDGNDAYKYDNEVFWWSSYL